MKDTKITRRDFAILAAGGALLSVFPGCALEAGISKTDTQALLRVARLLYPHDDLRDEVYKEALLPLRERAVATDNLAEVLHFGLEELDRVVGGEWSTAPEDVQVDALKRIENGIFFDTVQDDVRTELYLHPETWKLLGYEGSSVEYGGYINRGFDDIDWLTED